MAIGLYAARHASPGLDTAHVSPPALASPTGPPWIYGPPEARFTIVGYADLQCPYCRDYFPVLQQWIKTNTDVNWQWHHLPLTAHEPAATMAARLAECAGEIGGGAAFWSAIAWLYQQDTRDVSALIEHTGLREEGAAVNACVSSTRLDGYIQQQSVAASREGVYATPTLRIVDRQTGRAVLLSGPAENDVLLSAIDFLLTPEDSLTKPRESQEPSADASRASDMPR